MHSRRSFFGSLAAGLAALVSVPAWARESNPERRIPPGEFHTPSHDTSFLEDWDPVSMYEWDQEMVVGGQTRRVRRIKIMVRTPERLDIPVMFDIPRFEPVSLAGSVYPSGGAGESPRRVEPKSLHRLMLPAFELTEDGYIYGEEPQGQETGSPDPDVLLERLRRVIDALPRHPRRGTDSYPLWITLHQGRQPVRHMMACTPYPLGVDDMLLTLPASVGRKHVFAGPPSPYDWGEDGPWKANVGLAAHQVGFNARRPA